MPKVDTFTIPFPDFKMGDVMDSEQFDENNNTIVEKVNEVIGVMNDEKTDLTGDHKGTWQGYTPGQVAESINGGRLDVLEPIVHGMEQRLTDAEKTSENTSSTVIQLKGALQNAQQEIANLNLYTDANNRVKTGYTYGTNFDAIFGMDIDYTKTNANSNLSIGQTILPTVSADGFKVGQEVTVYDDVNLERVKITAISGTNITIATGLTKEFKNGANIARTMFDKDTNAKTLTFGGWRQSGTKRALYLEEGKSQQSQGGGSFAPLRSIPVTAHTIGGIKQFSIDMDVVIPHYSTLVNPNSHSHTQKTLFALGGTLDIYNEFSVGYTGEPYTHASEMYNNKNNISGIYYEDIQHSIYFNYAYENSASNTSYTRVMLATPKDFLKNLYGKNINLKIVVDISSLSGIAPSFKLYVNGVLIPMRSIEVKLATAGSTMNVQNMIRMSYVRNTTDPTYGGLSYHNLAKFIMYRSTNFTNKIVEYLFDADILNNIVVDTSGNGNNMTIPNKPVVLPTVPQYPVVSVDKQTVNIPTSDLRYKATLDSKELGVWITRDAKLTPVEGKYGDVAMELKTVGEEDQFIGATRDTASASDVRITYNREPNEFFPSIKKIVGGVY